MDDLAVYCADVGALSRRTKNFGWASRDGDGKDARTLANALADDLNSERPVALGFECPLFVPIQNDPGLLTSARRGEGDRSWSASAGALSLAAGLTEAVWILQEVKELVASAVPAYVSWSTFREAERGLFLWEAFVTGSAKSVSHVDDAKVAVRCFVEALPQIDEANAIHEDNVQSLIGAALIRTGWSSDASLLATPCIVLKP